MARVEGLDLPQHTALRSVFCSRPGPTIKVRLAVALCVASSHAIFGPFESRLAWNDEGGAKKVAPPKG